MGTAKVSESEIVEWMERYNFKRVPLGINGLTLYQDKNDDSPGDVVVGFDNKGEGITVLSWNYPSIYFHIPSCVEAEIVALAAKSVHQMTRQYLYSKGRY